MTPSAGRRPAPRARHRSRPTAAVNVAVSREQRLVAPPSPAITAAVQLVLRAERIRSAAISIALVSDATIRRLNRRYLRHRRVTDVIAFALTGEGPAVVGDVYIAPGAARRAAAALGISAREEILRLVVHGVLHVLGYDHPAGAGRTRSAMWRRQELLLARVLRRVSR